MTKFYRRFGETDCLLSSASSSETLVNFYQTAQRHFADHIFCISLAFVKHQTASVTSLTTVHKISVQCSSVEERDM